MNGVLLENGEGPPEESKPRIRRGLYNMSIHQVCVKTIERYLGLGWFYGNLLLIGGF